MHRTLRYFGIMVLALGFGLLNSGAAAAQAPTTISIRDNLFSPAQVQGSSGATLTWSNDGGQQHTVTADDGSFDSGSLNSGDTFSFTFDAPGTYAYYCQIHGGPGGEGMAGKVVVAG